MTARKKPSGTAKKVKDLKPASKDVKGGTRREDWTIGHVTSVKFPK